MRKPAILKRPNKTRISKSTSFPAPVGGWNARDPIANMDPKDAILLDNWWPTASDVMLRKGYDKHHTNLVNQVESLMVYAAPSGTEKMFGAAGTSFFHVTNSGSTASAPVTGLTNARWQWDMFTTTAATYGIAANGVDNVRYYDGTTWTAVTASTATVTRITGVATTALKHPWVHKNRLWFVEKDSLTARYMPTDAVGGAATAFRLNGVASKGGSLLAGGTWTIDAGVGVDDHWVAVTSEGQVIVYKGTDVSSASTWALVGVWNIAEPLGAKPLIKWAGDLLIVTKEGVLPLAKALVSATVDPKVALTDKIRQAMSTAAALYGSNYGWQMLHYPNADMLLLNVPTSTGSDQHQYAMNTITGSWGRFKDIDANCWALFGGEPYFGGNGFVGKFWGVFDDNDANIEADVKQAFNYFGSRGMLKDFKDIRPTFASDGSPSVLVSLNLDYNDDAPSGTLSFTPTSYGVWDSALWDTGIWGGGLAPFSEWQGVGGTGTCAALRMRVAAKGLEVRHQATDYLYEEGGVIG